MATDTLIGENQKAGLEVNTRETFPVTGMSCAACAVSVESVLKASPGVKDAGVNFATQTAWAEYNARQTNALKLQNAVRSVGYDLVINAENPSSTQEEVQHKNYLRLKRQTIGASILALPVFILGMFFMEMPYFSWISMVLAAPVVFWFGRNFFISAFKQARHRKANMDTLVALSTGIAFVFSAFNTIYPQYWHSRGLHAHVYFEAASVIIAFILLGKLLEEHAKSNTSSAIKKLMGLQPKTVRILIEGKEQEIPISDVKSGDIVLVRPGEKIPVDGLIVSGSSFVDESLISGEPVPVKKAEGVNVFTGSINQKGSFQFKAEKVGSETLLAHIIKMVQEAQGSKAPSQKLADKIAGIFVPAVIGIALFTFIVWMIFSGENAFTHALLAAITVLVIACPCALGLATPTAIMVGIGKGAENNILIKDAESLELGHRINAVVLDKTGTITEGKPRVTDIYWLIEKDLETLKSVLYSLEIQSEHPLSEAIVSELKSQKVLPVQTGYFESITARGVSGKFKGIKYFAGNKKLLLENGIEIPETAREMSEQYQKLAKTVIYFADEKSVLAVTAIADRVKETSVEAVKELKELGIEIYMLTGDNRQTAAAVAAEAGINNYQAEVLPSDKENFIKNLQQRGKVVAMVGDGINDSQALARADVSIAMGKGSDIAIDVATMTLISPDLRYVTKALKLSAKTMKTVKQNLFWAFIYNLIGIPLAAGMLYPFTGFLLNPMIAGAAMALSSVSVVTNSLRLKSVHL